MKRSILTYDSETCGLAGFVVLIQYAVDDGPIVLHEVWYESVKDTLALIEGMMTHDVVGFNLAFDHFQLVKCYTVFREYVKRYPHLANKPPEIALVVECEEAGMDGPCLKPAASCDLMLHSRKDPRTQTLMNRGDVRIRRVPTELACALADELDERLDLPEVYWERQKDKTIRWRVYDIDDCAHFKDVVLKFNPSAGLKMLAKYFLGQEPPFAFDDIACEAYPVEIGYAPTAAAVYRQHGGDALAWPDVIQQHIDHWHTNANARAYAELDVVYTRMLYQFFGSPEAGDTDSELACMVAAVRWHGFTVDLEGIKALRAEARKVIDAAPLNVNSTAQVREYLLAVMDSVEALLLADSTRAKVLEEIATWKDNDEAAGRAKTILKIRKANKEVELFDKLLLARRLHADLNVIGALSSRMSGSGGLNVQAIKADKKVRRCFPLAWEGMELCGGDFSNFEGTIADAVYQDAAFRKLITGTKKPAGIFGELIYPHLNYDEILASDGHDPDYYTDAKSAYFATLYLGTAFTLHVNQGIPMDIAEEAIVKWYELVPGMREKIREVEQAHSALVQVGPGFQWRDPAPYVENLLGFRRSFELENTVIKILFGLAQNPPKEWREKKIKVVRRQKIQTASGAVQSALYGAAFSIQNANIRAAGNHRIQSTGALICKDVQRRIWDLQPCGVNEWKVAPLQVHDELQCPCSPDMVNPVRDAVQAGIVDGRKTVELLGMKWTTHAANWAEGKKAGGQGETYDFKP